MSFADKQTEALFHGKHTKKYSGIETSARIRLNMLHAATSLEELYLPPSNHLEALKGNRKTQHSIRINRQWRICFTWTSAGPKDVEIIDYH